MDAVAVVAEDAEMFDADMKSKPAAECESKAFWPSATVADEGENSGRKLRPAGSAFADAQVVQDQSVGPR